MEGKDWDLIYQFMVFLRLYPLGLFSAFDVNCDSHIDLSEMVNAVALCCRKPEEERHKCECHRRLCGGCIRWWRWLLCCSTSHLPLPHIYQHTFITRKCMTLWGEPDRVHPQNMEQLHAFDCHQNVAEP